MDLKPTVLYMSITDGHVPWPCASPHICSHEYTPHSYAHTNTHTPRMSSEEGFICPLCLVSFSSSSKLSGHFIEIHSDNYATIRGQPETEEITTEV